MNKMSLEETLEFARSIKDFSQEEQKKAIFEKLDNDVLDIESLRDVTAYDDRPCYLPGLFDSYPTIETLYQVHIQNIENEKNGVPPVCAL